MNHLTEDNPPSTLLDGIIIELQNQNADLWDITVRLDRLANKLDSDNYPKNFPKDEKGGTREGDNRHYSIAKLDCNLIDRRDIIQNINIALTYLEKII